MTILKGGQNICGVSIGVVSLESRFPKPPGHIKNPSGLPFTVAYEIMDGVTVPRLLGRPDADIMRKAIDAALRLEDRGVRAITGSCGFLALFQKELSRAVKVPVFSSALVQVPLAFHLSGSSSPVGVLTASSSSLTPDHLEAAGASGVPVSIQGMEEFSEFSEVILRNERDDMDIDRIESEILAAGGALKTREPGIKSVVLECTDMSAFAHSLQREIGLPVYDLTSLAGMIDTVVRRTGFSGFV